MVYGIRYAPIKRRLLYYPAHFGLIIFVHDAPLNFIYLLIDNCNTRFQIKYLFEVE
jgi:hypothetical protein